MFFEDFAGLARIVVAAVVAYAWLVLALRVAGKRSLAELNAFDLVVTVALGSTFATVVLSKDVPLLEGILALAVLAVLQWIVSRLSVSSSWFKRLVRSDPRLLFEHGSYRERAMASERVTRSEVDAAIRSAGLGRPEGVGAVVLETDGSLSVIASGAAELTILANVRR
jgi:uncharacterized membrane protein YcaP (DUF421 family)